MRRIGHAIALFWHKAYQENLTGLAGMVAYNLLLSILPVALIALFVAGQVLESSELERQVLDDLSQLFPSTANATLRSALDHLKQEATTIGLAAIVASIWIGMSFWGALDTAFCRIYHFECRSWFAQKRFSLVMLVVALALMVLTVAVPTVQGLLVESADDLPFGIGEVGMVVAIATLVIGALLLFAVLCVVYWAVPNRLVPWRAIWPGAFGATLVIAGVDYVFPWYLSNVSTFATFGGVFVTVLVVLLWFYVLAIVMLGGAVINALRYEHSETGRIVLRARPCAEEATAGGAMPDQR